MAVSATMGVPLLVVAAAVLGIVAGVEAQRTQSLTSPIVLHVVWSLSMLLVLPTLLGAA
jgi:membrane protease YdiL (CAAX protease family)